MIVYPIVSDCNIQKVSNYNLWLELEDDESAIAALPKILTRRQVLAEMKRMKTRSNFSSDKIQKAPLSNER